MGSQIRATYLVANAAWVVTFGDQILDLEDKRFFDDLEELDYCLRLHGLKRGRGNQIHNDPSLEAVTYWHNRQSITVRKGG